MDVKLSGGIQLVKNTVDVKVKRLSPDAVLPKYAKANDAGQDLTAISKVETQKYIEYGTGLALEIPRGYVGLIYPRSSLSNYDMVLANHVGVIDADYRGEIKFRFKKTNEGAYAKYYEVGDRIGQLIVVPFPVVQWEEVSELEETERGSGGYGSSGK